MPAPAAPTSFFVQQANGQVLLTWGQVAGATAYSVKRSTDNVTFTSLATPATFNYLDTTALVGVNYYYIVAATNGSGTGPYTNSQSITPTLAGQMTLGQLRLLAQQKADRVNSNFVTVPEWNVYINQSYFDLYDLLVQKYGNEYYVAPPYVFTTTGSQFYGLPDGTITYPVTPGSSTPAMPFYKLLGVDLGLDTTDNAFITLKKFEFISRNRYVYPQITTSLLGIAGLRYRMMGNQLMVIPTPAANQIMRIWYIPRMTALLKDTDVVDGVSGWTEYIAVDAAIKALVKEESDVSALILHRQALEKRIEEAAENRDAGEPETISDTRRYTDLYGTGFGYGLSLIHI